MCGIFGQLKLGGFSQEEARRALNSLAHRGPDQWSDWDDEHVYCGHRRLSIMDLSEAGRQPMIGHGVILTVNGEIWNFMELREELIAQGYKFNSQSDSEVLLHGYHAWGWDRLLERIDGMYAFSIYDTNLGKLCIARDRFGIKPLYYAAGNFGFGYASEVKALFEWRDELRCFSLNGVRDWLLYRGGQSGLTPYYQIVKLLPGHSICVDVRSGDVDVRKYYDVVDHIGDKESDPNDLPDVFEEAVSRRLMADVPVGLQLSGGVDSSLVGHAMHKLYDTDQINSFSVGFDAENEAHLSEEPFARYVADKYGFTHHQYNINRKMIAENFEHVLWLADGMLDYPNTVPIYLLSRYAKQNVTVQLTGEGADELFAGYTKFKKMAGLSSGGSLEKMMPDGVIDAIGNMDARVGRMLHLRKHYTKQNAVILNSLNSYISASTVEQMFGPHEGHLLRGDTCAALKEFSFSRQLILADHKTYLVAVLERQDKSSMGAAIESRVPFLDRNLIEWAMNLDEDILFGADETKKILKDYAADIFSHDFAYRKKVGFPLPLKNWMESDAGLKPFRDKIYQSDFLLSEYFMHYKKKSFDHILLHYGDSESQWVEYFMMVLRSAQDVFGIREVRP
ncbi:MAG: asparagine synthase (glutamine-hydrolyzing) [Alphaproteobacteria bacterium]|nr:asparagine synthase (glutamine-hydrolyzing) [Alphaproteobacteria bacterium]